MAMTFEGLLADRSRWRTDDCSIGKAMDLIGTRSAVLLIREAYYGTTRFDDFVERVGITDAVAAARLKQLVAAGVLEKRPYQEPGKRTRYEYVLTRMGEDLLPAVLALMQWGDTYLQPSGGPLTVVQRETGSPVTIRPRSRSGDDLGLDDLAIVSNDDWVAARREAAQ
ncbi:winged helix-turn-helix transcriptional regulator [Planotetraspora kaengkrachanensis]|uniref:Putative transcriptional regulator n=1 Tax=Planotetraspora kaengkrachanensis TaxID=575193 RepID=A0A8J3LW64_9ACTN|nr:helix-turn-helix domain-containing protein [Planotetraspora kaengkrachanensis]GIG78929.1 putative transcriptional regulator [Planotetraspora kaengkrachanensis]